MKTTIEKGMYEGYMWMSDASSPQIYDGTKEVAFELDDSANPFVIEGNLWDKSRRMSVCVRFVDGAYHVRTVNVTEEDERSQDNSEKTFVAHRLKGVKALRYLQYWTESKDAFCENMPVLRPDKLVFVGFKYVEQND